MEETVYTVPEVAEYLKICKSKLYSMIRKGEFPHIRIGKNVRILESDLIDYIEQQVESMFGSQERVRVSRS